MWGVIAEAAATMDAGSVGQMLAYLMGAGVIGWAKRVSHPSNQRMPNAFIWKINSPPVKKLPKSSNNTGRRCPTSTLA